MTELHEAFELWVEAHQEAPSPQPLADDLIASFVSRGAER